MHLGPREIADLYAMGIFGVCVGLRGIAGSLNNNGSGVLFLWAIGILAFMAVPLTASHREESRLSS
jgi:hypothetical protein